MKNIIKTIAIVSIFAIIFSMIFTGCGQKEEPSAPVSIVMPSENTHPVTVSEQTEPETDAQGNTLPKQESLSRETTEGFTRVSKDFVIALIKKDYETAFNLFNLPKDKSLVTANDIKNAAQTNSFKNLSKLTPSTVSIVTEILGANQLAATCNIFVKDKTTKKEITSVKIKTKRINNDKWAIDVDGFFYKNFMFVVPGGSTTVKVNGITISKNFCTQKNIDANTKLMNEYTIPYVPKGKVNVAVSSPNFSYSEVLKTSENNTADYNIVSYVLNDSQKAKCCEFVKDAWTKMYKAAAKGQPASDALFLLSKDADKEIVNSIWKGFAGLRKQKSEQPIDRYDNFKITKLIANPKARSYYVTDNKVLLCFDYQLEWDFLFDETHHVEKKCSKIVLNVENGNLSIANIIDYSMFSENDPTVKEW